MLLLTTFPLAADERAVIGAGVDVVCLADVATSERIDVLRRGSVLLAANLKGFAREELASLADVRLVQFMTAGVDHIPLADLPRQVPVASNAGAYAEPMAEHALALALAAAKRLIVEHAALTRGEFNQFTPNRMLAGGVCGILGLGGVGMAAARLMRAVGMRVHAINRSTRTNDLVDWAGGPAQLDELLDAADVLVISLPLTRATLGLIDARRLALMKRNAILINLARGEIVDEAALYQHLVAHRSFTACIDAWWIEPIRHGEFRVNHPFLALPNVIASPHNSGSVPAGRTVALRRALENCGRALRGEPVANLVSAEDRLQ